MFVCHCYLISLVFIVLTVTYIFSFFIILLLYLAILLLALNIYFTIIKAEMNFFTACIDNYILKCFLCKFVLYYLIIVLILLRFLHIKTSTLFFGQLILTPKVLKILYIFILWNCLVIYCYMQWHITFSNLLIYSFITYLISCICWFLWACASLFTIIFLFDTLNLLLYLLFFNSLDKKYLKVNEQTWVGGFLSGFTVFFWMSFLSTVCFLLFSYYTYLMLHTFSIYLLNSNAVFLFNIIIWIDTLKLYFYFFFFIIFIALKLGIAPFLLWKFSFFQNLNFFTLFIYLFSYYFLISIFFFINFYNYFLYAYAHIQPFIYIYLIISIFFILITFSKISNIYTFYIYSSLLNINIILLVLFVVTPSSIFLI